MNTVRDTTLRLIRRLGLIRAVNVLANCWFALLKWIARSRGVSDIDAIYGKRYFEAQTRMTSPTAARVVESLLDVFPADSVVDIGCGTGVYLREFENRGVEIMGYEGSSHAIAAAEVDRKKIVQFDLRQPLVADRQYDLVISFEVAEHLDAQYSDTFVRTVASFGDRIVFSAAQPGQGGTDHTNEQPPECWIEKFRACGRRYEAEQTRRIRELLRVGKLAWWLEKNILVFRRERRPE